MGKKEQKDMPVLMKMKIGERYFYMGKQIKEKVPGCKVVGVYEEGTIMTSELQKIWANKEHMKKRKAQIHWNHQKRVTMTKTK